MLDTFTPENRLAEVRRVGALTQDFQDAPADGTCTVGSFTLPNSVTSTDLMVDTVDKSGSLFWQDPRHDPMAPDARRLTTYNPLVGPSAVTYPVRDLDAIAWTSPPPKL